MKLVICEGADDAAVVSELCIASGIAGITVEHYGGRSNLEAFLRELPKRPDFARGEVESLGVTIDADTNGAASWQKLQNAVQQGIGVQLTTRGTFVSTAPKIGGFVVARPDDTGMLEDMCLAAVQGKPGYPCLEEYFRCLAEKTERKQYLAKAKFRAWMASQSDFDLRTGKAAAKGYLPWDNTAFDPLRQFLKAL
jgi:hypothetical protein